jgi:cysteinylglycine-S-conjugate dipeptidase
MSLRDRVQAQIPDVLSDLNSLVAIESVSADPARASEVERSAQRAVGLLEDLGCPDARVVRADGGAPAVIGRFPAPEGMPTVCLYAHHDVQPEGDPAGWLTSPFAATEVEDRLFGRGTSDDKGGFAVHLAALRAFDGKPPVGVTVFVQGDEEVDSVGLPQLLEEHRGDLAADVFVITDSCNWAVGQPAFTTSLRGLAGCTVEVRTLDHALHSGVYGGVVPDALTALCRMLATLHDDEGNVAVAGLGTASAPALEYPPERLRGVRNLGWRPLDRQWVVRRAHVVQASRIGGRHRRDARRQSIQHLDPHGAGEDKRSPRAGRRRGEGVGRPGCAPE